jgi:O-antigen/teichoic acid export membrane protein
MSPAEVGAWFSIFSAAVILQTCSDLGASAVVMRELSYGRYPRRIVLRSGVRLTVIGSLLAVLVVLGPIGSWFLDVVGAGDDPWIAVASGLFVVVLVVQRFTAETLRGVGAVRASTLVAGSLARVSAVVVLALFLVADLTVGVSAVLVVQILAGLLAVVVGVAIVRRALRSSDDRDAPDGGGGRRGTITFAMTRLLLLHGLLWVTLQEGDVVIAGVLLEGAEIADYGVAWRVAVLTSVPIQVLNVVVTPRLAALLHAGDQDTAQRMVATAASVALVGALVIVGFLAAAGEDVLRIVFGGEYVSAYVPMIVLSLGQLANVLVGPSANALIAGGRDTDVVTGATIGVVVLIAGSVPFGQAFGATGIAAASATASASANLWWWVQARRRLGLRTDGIEHLQRSRRRSR